MKFPFNLLIIVALPVLFSCTGQGSKVSAGADTAVSVTVPDFNADSAYSYVAAQTAMGPRVPGSAAHAQCRTWLVEKLNAHGADTVTVQHGRMTDASGKLLDIYNIMGRFNPAATERVLLLAHYDTRPWADEDADAANHSRPIDGANDGASGVGALLEVARLLGQQKPGIGVDILFVDAEDSGISSQSEESADQALTDLTWCLGTQYFVDHLPYPAGSLPKAAILLDMVGGRNAVFKHEYFGYSQAPLLAAEVWQTAKEAGYSQRFAGELGGAVNDDHIHLLGAGIPTIDIIEIGHPETGTFNPTWHTMQDNLDNIDPETLKAVGQTVTNFVYKQ